MKKPTMPRTRAGAPASTKKRGAPAGRMAELRRMRTGSAFRDFDELWDEYIKSMEKFSFGGSKEEIIRTEREIDDWTANWLKELKSCVKRSKALLRDHRFQNLIRAWRQTGNRDLLRWLHRGLETGVKPPLSESEMARSEREEKVRPKIEKLLRHGRKQETVRHALLADPNTPPGVRASCQSLSAFQKLLHRMNL